MPRVLLDTHSFIWFVEGSPRLSGKARSEIEDSRNVKLFSRASAWEMNIKASLGKLPIDEPLQSFIS